MEIYHPSFILLTDFILRLTFFVALVGWFVFGVFCFGWFFFAPKFIALFFLLSPPNRIQKAILYETIFV